MKSGGTVVVPAGNGVRAIGVARACARCSSPRRHSRRRTRPRLARTTPAEPARDARVDRRRRPEPNVDVSINSFDAVEARHAYDDIIDEAAATYDIDPRMIKAVMQAESAFNAMAVSPVGAVGLMQLMPDVATELGVTDPKDPRQNIMAGSSTSSSCSTRTTATCGSRSPVTTPARATSPSTARSRRSRKRATT